MEHFRSIVFSFPITVISLAIKIQNGSLQIKLLSLLSCFFFLFLPILNFCLETYNEKDKKKKKSYVSLWKFRLLEDQGQCSIDPRRLNFLNMT